MTLKKIYNANEIFKNKTWYCGNLAHGANYKAEFWELGFAFDKTVIPIKHKALSTFALIVCAQRCCAGKARFKRRTLHVPNLMQMRKIYCFRSFALDSAHVKCCASCASFLSLPHFDVICDLLLNRRTATWNLFVKWAQAYDLMKPMKYAFASLQWVWRN